MWSRKGYQLWRDAFNDGHVLICDSEMIAFYQTRAEEQRVLIVSRQQGFEHAKLSVRRPHRNGYRERSWETRAG
jgi:hypothetical protein